MWNSINLKILVMKMCMHVCIYVFSVCVRVYVRVCVSFLARVARYSEKNLRCPLNMHLR